MSSVEDLQTFLHEWFCETDLIRVLLVKGGTRVCWTYTYDEVFSATTEDLDRLSKYEQTSVASDYYRAEPLNEDVNVFFQVHPVKDSDLTIYQKGGEMNTQTIRGVYLDLDIKEGSFQTQQEILDFLHELEVQPTILIDSGSGGLHAYYAFTEDMDTSAKVIQEKFISYVSAKLAPRRIDGLLDICREFRLPGSIRHLEDGSKSLVRVVEHSGTRVSYEALTELVEPYYEVRRKVLYKREQFEDELQCEMEDNMPGFLSVLMMEAYINRNLDWSDILVGWVHNRTQSDGTRQWQRPGYKASKRSATTDFPASPHTMSMFSTSDETGLQQLQDEKVKLTKFRVILKLHFNDDYDKMIDYFIPLMKNKREATQ